MKYRSALSVGTNGRYRAEGVIPSGAKGGVEESVGKRVGGWTCGSGKGQRQEPTPEGSASNQEQGQRQ